MISPQCFVCFRTFPCVSHSFSKCLLFPLNQWYFSCVLTVLTNFKIGFGLHCWYFLYTLLFLVFVVVLFLNSCFVFFYQGLGKFLVASMLCFYLLTCTGHVKWPCCPAIIHLLHLFRNCHYLNEAIIAGVKLVLTAVLISLFSHKQLAGWLTLPTRSFYIQL